MMQISALLEWLHQRRLHAYIAKAVAIDFSLIGPGASVSLHIYLIHMYLEVPIDL